MSAVDQPVGSRLCDALYHPCVLLQLEKQRGIATQHRNTSRNSGCKVWEKDVSSDIKLTVVWCGDFLPTAKKKKLTS